MIAGVILNNLFDEKTFTNQSYYVAWLLNNQNKVRVFSQLFNNKPHLKLLILGDLDRPTFVAGSAQEDLSDHLGVLGVRDIVLPHVPMDPVGEVEVLVIHGHDDVRHDTGHVG